jgi:hypothetical protein
MVHSRIKDLTDVYDLIPYQNNNHQQEKKDFQSKN